MSTRLADAPVAAPRPFAAVAGAVVFVAYFVGLHTLIVSRRFVPLTLLLIVAPWVGALVSAIARRALGTVVAAVAALGLVACAAWRYRGDLSGHVEALLYVENLVFLLAMAVLFGRTLVGDREALVTRFARIARAGDMPPRIVRYSRRLTALWAAFFVAAAVVSTTLYATQSHAVWSSFVNLAIWPAIGLIFVVEYGVRLRVFPDERPSSFATAFRAFANRDEPVDPRAGGDVVR